MKPKQYLILLLLLSCSTGIYLQIQRHSYDSKSDYIALSEWEPMEKEHLPITEAQAEIRKKKKKEDLAPMLSRLRKVYQEAKTKAKPAFTTQTLRKADAPVAVQYDVSGLEYLVLETRATLDGNSYDHGAWANAQFTDAKGRKIWATELEWIHTHSDWKFPVKNSNFAEKPIEIDGETYANGFTCHANGVVIVKLDKKYLQFTALCGVESGGHFDRSSIQFAIKTLSAAVYLKEVQKAYPDFVQQLNAYYPGKPEDVITQLDQSVEKKMIDKIIAKLDHPEAYEKQAHAVNKSEEYYALIDTLAQRVDLQEQLRWVKPESIALAVADLQKQPDFDSALATSKLDTLKTKFTAAQAKLVSGGSGLAPLVQEVVRIKRELLLHRSVLDFDELLVVNQKLRQARKDMAPKLGTEGANWKSMLSSPRRGFDAEIQLLSDLGGTPKAKTVYASENWAGINSVSLHWDANRVMFTTADAKNRWQIYELGLDGSIAPGPITQVNEPDLEFFDGAYLPNGKIVASSNIGYNGVPCVAGSDVVGSMVLYNPEDKHLRRLNFGQDNDWHPVVMNNGRIQYLRWEYTDNTHYFSRIMMHMNPDGTNKKELYGSGSYWPNSMFDPEPLPGKGNNAFVAIVSGHHGVSRSGRMVIFDPQLGRHEASGVVQEIPYRNKKVVPEIKDKLVDGVWPQFLTPMPINEKYYLVAAKLNPDSLWGIYLVDVFDNMTLIIETEGEGYLHPIPIRKKEVPPIIPERIKPQDTTATIYIQDIYQGAGTRGVPKGTIKELRVFGYEYHYINSPGNHMAQGIEAGWDIKRELGTVPVNEDGSVIFKVPANLPFSMQPVDKDGAAVQWMRSWITAMPGEVVSCVGCHEDQNTIARPKYAMASSQTPRELIPPKGGIRPFTFEAEIQPILDKRCVGCHNGAEPSRPNFKDTSLDPVVQMSQSYLNLHPYVRRQGPEADLRTMQPMEYHVSTSELIRNLRNGHHNVRLDEAEWQTLYKWIDFNTPYNGTFQATATYQGCDQEERRMELAQKYSNIKVDWRQELGIRIKQLKQEGRIDPVIPKPLPPLTGPHKKATQWGFDAAEAKLMQAKNGSYRKEIPLKNGQSMTLVRIPAGTYFKTDPVSGKAIKTKIDKAFWMGTTEVTNAQFQTLFPKHDSRFINQFWKDHVNEGYPANKPSQPVIRVSYEEAMAFCEQLSAQLGKKVRLPHATEWEWAARAGKVRDMPFDATADFSAYANLADVSLRDMAVTGVDPKPMAENNRLRPYYDFVPRSQTVNDGQMIVAEVGQYQPNAFGLYDMIGNVAEWTQTDYNKPLWAPFAFDEGYKTAKGYSWRDRASVVSFDGAEAYLPWQKVYNVGFRVVIEE